MGHLGLRSGRKLLKMGYFDDLLCWLVVYVSRKTFT